MPHSHTSIFPLHLDSHVIKSPIHIFCALVLVRKWLLGGPKHIYVSWEGNNTFGHKVSKYHSSNKQKGYQNSSQSFIHEISWEGNNTFGHKFKYHSSNKQKGCQNSSLSFIHKVSWERNNSSGHKVKYHSSNKQKGYQNSSQSFIHEVSWEKTTFFWP